MSSFIIFQIVVTILFVFVIFKIILPARGVKQITVDELRELLKDDSIQFIDVRPEAKYHNFHIHGFKNIPLKEIRKEADNLSKDKEVVLICQTGAHGNTASKRLKRRGFTKLTNVRGGLSTWEPIHIDRT